MPILVGDGNDNVIGGSAGDDTISGLGGDDRLSGLIGEDVLEGGAGDDVLIGGDDIDRLFGGNDEDTLRGGQGDDILRGGRGGDDLYGGGNDDVLFGDRGSDTLEGGRGADTFAHELDGSGNSGGDGIIDFVQGVDKLRIFGVDANGATFGRAEAFDRLDFNNDGFVNGNDPDVTFTIATPTRPQTMVLLIGEAFGYGVSSTETLNIGSPVVLTLADFVA